MNVKFEIVYTTGDKFQFVALFEVCADHLPLPMGEVPPKGGGEGSRD